MAKFNDALRTLHKDMKKNKRSFEIFRLTYNDISCDCIFNVAEKTNQIIFIRCSDAYTIRIPIRQGYYFDISNHFPSLYKLFNIRSGKGNFSLLNFLDHISTYIPCHVTQLNSAQRRTIQSAVNLEEAEKVFYNGLINWDKLNAVNNNKVGTRSQANLSKTEILFPDIFNYIKDKDISVRYSSVPLQKIFSPEELD